jgi:DNA-binding Lrp family transcriptional regulator
MVEPDRTLLILDELRAEIRMNSIELRNLNARLTLEFSEIQDRLRRLDGFITRLERLER